MRALTLGVAILLPAVGFSQLPTGMGQPYAQPTRTPRSFFRRAQPAPTPEILQPTPMPTPEMTATPRPATRSSEESSEVRKPRPTKEPEKARDRESSKEKESSKDSEKSKSSSKSDKDEMKTTDKDRDLSDSLEAVTDFLKAANDGKYSDAVKFLTPPVQRYFESAESVDSGGVKRVLDGITRDGDIKRVTSEVVVRGEGSRVDSDIEFGSGQHSRTVFDLLKTKDGWKIELPVTPQPAAPLAPRPPLSSVVAPAPVAEAPADAGKKDPLPLPAKPGIPGPGESAAAQPAKVPAVEESQPAGISSSPVTAPTTSALADAPWKVGN